MSYPKVKVQRGSGPRADLVADLLEDQRTFADRFRAERVNGLFEVVDLNTPDDRVIARIPIEFVSKYTDLKMAIWEWLISQLCVDCGRELIEGEHAVCASCEGRAVRELMELSADDD